MRVKTKKITELRETERWNALSWKGNDKTRSFTIFGVRHVIICLIQQTSVWVRHLTQMYSQWILIFLCTITWKMFTPILWTHVWASPLTLVRKEGRKDGSQSVKVCVYSGTDRQKVKQSKNNTNEQPSLLTTEGLGSSCLCCPSPLRSGPWTEPTELWGNKLHLQWAFNLICYYYISHVHCQFFSSLKNVFLSYIIYSM